MNLLRIEMRRALHRRAIRVLILLGLTLCVVAGLIAFLGSAGKSLAELRYGDDGGSPAIMTDWWTAEDDGGYLMVGTFFLFLGGMFGGATVAGGEWRHGTVTTLLTWEPRRLRLHTARSAGATVLAFVISFGLQILFLAAFLPAVFAHGTTEGADASFWQSLVFAMTRTSLLTAAAAALGIGLATLARNTAFAIITVFGWMAVVENLVRGLKPSLEPWLWGENLGTVIGWSQLPDVEFTRGPVVAAATIACYVTVIVVGAAWSFQRRDLAAAS